jgi:hypothetical protein
MTAGKVTSFANPLWPSHRSRVAAVGGRARISSVSGMPRARNSGVTMSNSTVWIARGQNSTVSYVPRNDIVEITQEPRPTARNSIVRIGGQRWIRVARRTPTR